MVTYTQLRASRVQWENALTAGTITYSQYMEIFNAYVAFWADLTNQTTFNAYNSVLATYNFTPLTESTPEPEPEPEPEPIVTYTQLIASRVQWEDAYAAGKIPYSQYSEIFSAFDAFYFNLRIRQMFNAYNSVLTKYGFKPLTGDNGGTPIIVWITIGGISIIAVIGAILYFKRKH